MRICLDFDGVIHDRSTWTREHMGQPIEGAVEHVRALYAAGHDIVVYTCMATSDSGTTAVRNWLIRHTLPSYEVTAVKPNCDVYVDDRALRFTNWPETAAAVRALAGA